MAGKSKHKESKKPDRPKRPRKQAKDSSASSKDGVCQIAGWFMSGSQPSLYSACLDDKIFKTGSRSARMINAVKNPSGFGTLMQGMDADEYVGKRLAMNIWIKTEGVDGWAAAWMRVDGAKGRRGRSLAFDNMMNRLIKGTTEWKKYQIVLDVPEGASKVAFGLMLSGRGKVWIDKVEFKVVSKKVPTTCLYSSGYYGAPRNLDFEEEPDGRDC